ncbi:glycine-rich cell wall structural protein 1-like [Penaeus japonicus]|uniref:glycine-rich cell wall structural protein 1-like n=1 Tax=Penaeus japonicus TaxID=27405 RepID=UPI001C70B67A|nr:glycine-rich cell wall structural protein 1-like [Penaeus japonicus]
MNPQRAPLRCAFVLVLVCMVSAAKLEGYSDGGDTGLGITLDDGELPGGAGASGVGGGSVIPAIFVGSGVIPESAFAGASGGASGGAFGGAVDEEYSAPGVGAAHETAGSFDAGVSGGVETGVVAEEYSDPTAGAEEYIPPSAGPEVAPVDVLPAPSNAYITPRN